MLDRGNVSGHQLNERLLSWFSKIMTGAKNVDCSVSATNYDL